MGVDDIRSGRRRVVMVGTSEAPIMPEIIDGYDAMGALATDDGLKKLMAVVLPTIVVRVDHLVKIAVSH